MVPNSEKCIYFSFVLLFRWLFFFVCFFLCFLIFFFIGGATKSFFYFFKRKLLLRDAKETDREGEREGNHRTTLGGKGFIYAIYSNGNQTKIYQNEFKHKMQQLLWGIS